MASADFFTRLVALNSIGPNVLRPAAPGGVNKVYICGNCDTIHNEYFAAQTCCTPEVFTEYQCPACQETYGDAASAADCCGKAGSGAQPMQCPICMRGAESFEMAADCCLHTHPTMTALGRWRVAEMVEAGTPWAEAIAQNVNH